MVEVISSFRALKFNVGGVASGKPRLEGIGGFLCNFESRTFLSFSKNIGDKILKEAEIVAILEALRLCIQVPSKCH